MWSLLDFLMGRSLNPFLVSAAAWPDIKRAEWNQHWNNARVCGAYAESMLSMRIFTQALRHFREGWSISGSLQIEEKRRRASLSTIPGSLQDFVKRWR